MLLHNKLQIIAGDHYDTVNDEVQPQDAGPAVLGGLPRGCVHVDGICARCGHWHMVYPSPLPALCEIVAGRRLTL